MRVLHVLPSLDQRYGGPIRAVLDLSARSGLLGLESEIVGLGQLNIPDNPFRPEAIHKLPLGRPQRYCYSPSMLDWLRQNLRRFDGVVLHGMWLYPNAAVEACCREMDIPYVCFPHGMLEPWSVYGQGPWKAAKKSIYWHLREHRIFENAAAVFFTTPRERSLALDTFSLPNSSFIVVPYGVDYKREAALAPDRSDLKPNPNDKLALFLGRVHPKKNVELLIDAWAEAGPHPGWVLLVAGPGEPDYISSLNNRAAKLRIGDQVRFVGAVTGADKSYLLGRASWFLLPSKQENFGIAVLEAINMSCPVAVSDQVYISDAFHSESEVLPLKKEAWVTFIRDRMKNEEHRSRLRYLDRQSLVPKFSIEAVTENWVKTIRHVFTPRKRVIALPEKRGIA